MISALVLGVSLAGIAAADPVPDFKLRNHNTKTAHGTNLVSPRNYEMQISAYYFAASYCSVCRDYLDLLSTLRNELRTSGVPVNIEIMGINQSDAASSFYNSTITAGRTMPWLQDTPEDGVWAKWGVAYRDVRILDTSNRVAAVFNLTVNPLTAETNRLALKQLFLNLAAATDSDGDRLPDHWEWKYLKTLAQRGDDDADNDGASNQIELLLGSDPLNFRSRPQARYSIDEASRFTINYNRWGGKAGDFGVGSSLDLKNWAGDWTVIFSERNQVDGSGMFEVSASFESSVVNQPMGFLRLNAWPLP